MNIQQVQKIIKSQLKPLNIVVFFLVLGLILSLLFYLVLHNLSGPDKKQQTEKKEGKIRIVTNENEVTINKNGMMSIKTPTKAFNQKWDENKTKELFKSIEQKAKDSDQCNSVIGDGIEIFYIEGNETKIICVEEGDQEIILLLEIVNNIDTSGQSLSSLFKNYTFSTPPASFLPSISPSPPTTPENDATADNDEPSPPPSDGDGSSDSDSQQDDDWDDCPFWRVSYCVWPPNWAPVGSSPKPNPSLPPPLPSLAPQPGVQDEPDCSLWDQLISGKTVVSNTLCINEEE